MAGIEWTDHHLTPRGWEIGAQKDMYLDHSDSASPEGSVLCVRVERTEDMYSKATCEVIWRTENKELLERLIEQFGTSGFNRWQLMK